MKVAAGSSGMAIRAADVANLAAFASGRKATMAPLSWR